MAVNNSVSQDAIPVWLNDGTGNAIGTAGNPVVTSNGGSGATSQQVQGNVANGVTDSGNPVKIGGYASAAAPGAVTDGQRVNAWFGQRGQQSVQLIANNNGVVFSGSIASGGVNGGQQAVGTIASLWAYDGSTGIVPVRQEGGVLWVVPRGGANIANNQVAVTTTATLVVAARANRQKVTITSTSAVVFYVGTSTVTAANGLYVAGTAGASITLDTAAAVYAVGAANVTLSYVEYY